LEFFTGADSKLMIDSGYSGSQKQIADALASISGDPIKHLINTHWHFDHTDGNEWMHSAGARITAHENTKKHLSATTRVEDWNFTFPPLPAGAIPTDVFTTDKALHLNGATIALKCYGDPHRQRHFRLFPRDRSFTHRRHVVERIFPVYRLFDWRKPRRNDQGRGSKSRSGNGENHCCSCARPGRRQTEKIEYRDLLVTIRDRVAALKGEGKSLDEISAAKPTAGYDAKWGKGFVNGDFFTKLVYKGLG
jgi:metallo-beta-lactamase superfamily protein